MNNKPLWIKEAEKYIGTKEIPGIKHEPLILSWWKKIKRGGIKTDEVPWCFTGDTEIMTESGWVRFDELDNERVYQSDEYGAISLCAPVAKIIKECSGEVFDIAHRSIRLTCDVGHRWWGRWGKSGKNKFGTFDNIPTDGLSIPSVSASAKGTTHTNSELIFLAAFLSDGKLRMNSHGAPRDVEFEVSKDRKITALRALNPAHEYTQKKAYGPLTKTPLTVFRFRYPAYFNDVMIGYKLLSHDFVNALSAAQARTFLAAYAQFDGNGATEGATNLYTSSKELLDSIIFIATLAGYNPSVQSRTSPLSGRPTWVIAFTPGKSWRHIKRSHVHRRKFEGLLYCVEVPLGRIVVRGQGSSPVVTGNCAAFVGAMLEEAGIVSTRFESAKSYFEWGTLLTAPTYGCIVVFERNGGGHVGFVVGRDTSGRLLVLGGNQGDKVSIAPFKTDRVLGYRWPKAIPFPGYSLTVAANNDPDSSNES